MKILIIPPGELPIPALLGGAIETLTTYLIDENEKISGGVEFVVMNHQIQDYPQYKNTTIISIKKNIRYYAYGIIYKLIRAITFRKKYLPNAFIHEVNKLLKKESFDLIIVEGEYIQGLSIQNWRTDLWLHLHTDLLYPGTIRCKECAAKYQKVICVSEFIKNRVRSIGNFEDDQIVVLKNCADTAVFNLENTSRMIDKMPIPQIKDKKIIAYCGRLSPEKGILELIKVLSLINDENVILLIIGSSWFSSKEKNSYTEKIEFLINELQLDQRIFFTGYIGHNDIPAWLRCVDLVAVPSICNEAASLISIEAQCCGIPVVASKLGGIPEYVGEEYLVDYDENFVENFASKVINVLENKNCYKYADVYDKNHYYRDFISLLK